MLKQKIESTTFDGSIFLPVSSRYYHIKEPSANLKGDYQQSQYRVITETSAKRCIGRILHKFDVFFLICCFTCLKAFFTFTCLTFNPSGFLGYFVRFCDLPITFVAFVMLYSRIRPQYTGCFYLYGKRWCLAYFSAHVNFYLVCSRRRRAGTEFTGSRMFSKGHVTAKDVHSPLQIIGTLCKMYTKHNNLQTNCGYCFSFFFL